MINYIKNIILKFVSTILTDKKFHIGTSCTIQDIEETPCEKTKSDLTDNELIDIYGNKVFKLTKKYKIKHPHDSYELVGVRIDNTGTTIYELSSILTRDTMLVDSYLFKKYFEASE